MDSIPLSSKMNLSDLVIELSDGWCREVCKDDDGYDFCFAKVRLESGTQNLEIRHVDLIDLIGILLHTLTNQIGNTGGFYLNSTELTGTCERVSIDKYSINFKTPLGEDPSFLISEKTISDFVFFLVKYLLNVKSKYVK